MVHFRYLIIVIVFALILGSTHLSCAKTDQLAPDFTLNDINGNKVTLSQFRGKVVILNFWSIWCGPCVAEMPSLDNLYRESKDKGLVVIAIAVDNPEKAVRSFIEEKKLTFLVLLDKDKKVYFKYSLYGIPVTLLIDRKGFIAEKFIGERDWNSPEMKEKVIKLLKE